MFYRSALKENKRALDENKRKKKKGKESKLFFGFEPFQWVAGEKSFARFSQFRAFPGAAPDLLKLDPAHALPRSCRPRPTPARGAIIKV
jgi:hypothetical protein